MSRSMRRSAGQRSRGGRPRREADSSMSEPKSELEWKGRVYAGESGERRSNRQHGRIGGGGREGASCASWPGPVAHHAPPRNLAGLE
eukprot:scaffold22980_cov114-Isochrysis_galbana.AAC.2